MRHRLFLAAAALFTLAACSESPTAPAPRTLTPGARSLEESPGPDGTCRNGYQLITRGDGTQYCEPI
jgi:hypothetical protein